MKGMIPRNKMSWKARKEMDAGKRNTWTMNPVTRIRESGKVYDRKKLRNTPED